MKRAPKTEGVNPLMKYTGLGMQLGLTIAIFAWLGHYLDGKFATSQPLWTAGLSLFGVLGGLYSVFKQLPKN